MKITNAGLVVGSKEQRPSGEERSNGGESSELSLDDKHSGHARKGSQTNVLTPTPAAAEAAAQHEMDNTYGYPDNGTNITKVNVPEEGTKEKHDEEEKERGRYNSCEVVQEEEESEGSTEDEDNDGEEEEEIKYEDLALMEVIGAGSSGYVRRAVHKRTGEEYALKIVKFVPEAGMDEIAKAGLVELQSLSKINSPHVVKFHNAFFINGEISILCEYMNAGTLKDLTKARPIPESILGRIAEQVLKGLSYLHKQHFMHRDIKPTNLLVNTQGEVKIADFGVSNRKKHTFSACNSMIGTVTYMSPERILAEPYKIDSDIWSFGLVVLECATGLYPYSRSYRPRLESSSSSSSSGSSSASSGGSCNSSVAERISRTLSSSNITTLELMGRIVNEPAPLAPDTSSQAFRSFVAECLQKTPANRPTAAALLGHDWIKQCEAHGARVYAWVRSTLNIDFEF